MGKRNRFRIERISKGEEQPISCGKSQSAIMREVGQELLSSPFSFILKHLAHRATSFPSITAEEESNDAHRY